MVDNVTIDKIVEDTIDQLNGLVAARDGRFYSHDAAMTVSGALMVLRLVRKHAKEDGYKLPSMEMRRTIANIEELERGSGVAIVDSISLKLIEDKIASFEKWGF